MSLPNPTAISGVVRAGNWWHSKLPPLLSVVYAAALLLGLDAASTAEMWLAALVSLLGIASYGHVVNDAFDIEVDRLAGKPNAMAPYTVWQRTFIAAALLALSLLPAALLPFGLTATALVAVNCLLPTLYSAPPVRIKERGVWALLFDAGGAHVVPTLWIAVACLKLAGDVSPWGVAFGVVMTAWALTVGIKGILRHQMYDLEGDEQAGVTTLAGNVRSASLVGFLERGWYFAELAMFAAVVVLLAPVAPLLPVAVLAYLPLEWKKYSLGWQFKFDPRDRHALRHLPLANNYFYELALPAVLLAHLAWRQPWLAWLLPLHLLLFWRNIYVQWADLKRLVQHARDVRQGRESLLRFRGAFEQAEHARGTLRVLASNPRHYQLRVTEIDGQLDHLRFCHGPWRIEAGQSYAVQFRARSDSLRQAVVGVRQASQPWTGLGLNAPIFMDPRWRTHQLCFTATADEPQAVLFITLGAALGPLEIDDIRLTPIAAADRWALMCEESAAAQCITADAPPGAAAALRRVELLAQAQCPESVRLHQLGIALEQGQTYRLELTARADGPRRVDLGVCHVGDDWRGLGLAETAWVTGELRTYRFDFLAAESDADACAYLWLGGAAGMVDVAEFSVTALPAAAAWQLIRDAGVEAQLIVVEGPTVRLEPLIPGSTPDQVRLALPALPVERGEYYAAKLELRAERPRTVIYGLSQRQEPFAGLGLIGEVELTPQWQTVTVDFRATADDPCPCLYLLAGGDATPVEVRIAELQTLGRRHPYFLQFAPDRGAVRHTIRLPYETSDAATLRLLEAVDHRDDVTLYAERFSVEAGRHYELIVRARSTMCREVEIGFGSADPPWENLGLTARLWLTPRLQAYVVPFQATQTRRFARACLWLGGPNGMFEVAGVQLRPTASDDVPWELRCATDSAAQCSESDGRRVELIECGRAATDAQLVFHVGAVRPGARYRAKLRLRAKRSRSVALYLAQLQAPWQSLAEEVSVLQIDSHWRDYYLDFSPHTDEPAAGLYLNVGGDAAAVDFANIEFLERPANNPWRLESSDGAGAQLLPTTLDDAGVCVEFQPNAEAAEVQVKLALGGFQVAEGRWQQVSFRARTNLPHRITCTVQQDHAPWKGLGYFRAIELDEEWRTFLGGFVGTQSDESAALRWFLDGSRHSVEIADVQVRPCDSLLPLQLSTKPGCDAVLLAGEEADSLRLVPLAVQEGAGDIWLSRPQVAAEAGQRYRLRFDARADAPLRLAVGCIQGEAPWAGIGLYRRIEAAAAWQTFDFEFEATLTDLQAKLCFWLGENLTPLELRRVSLVRLETVAGESSDTPNVAGAAS